MGFEGEISYGAFSDKPSFLKLRSQFHFSMFSCLSNQFQKHTGLSPRFSLGASSNVDVIQSPYHWNK